MLDHDVVTTTQTTQGTVVETVERPSALVKATRLIWLMTGALESAIGIRFILKLIAANPDAGFARFIYGMTQLFLLPFQGLTATPSANGAVLEISSLIAMLVYALLAQGIVKLIWIVFDNSEASAAKKRPLS